MKIQIRPPHIVASLLLLISLSACEPKGNSQNSTPADSLAAASTEIVVGDTAKMIDSYLSQLVKDKGFSGGLLILRNGQKILSKGYGFENKEAGKAFTSATLASMGSITKAFTATAILKLEEEGRLKVEDRLDKHFPDVPKDKAGITLHQLLTHSSGMQDFLKNDGGDYAKVETEEFLRRAWAEPLVFAPGSNAIYSNMGMSILGILIEQLTGMEYEEYLRQHVLSPIGIHNIGYHRTSGADSVAHGYEGGKDWGTIPLRFKEAGGGPYWNLKGNGGLEANLQDMALWINAFTDAKVLSKANIDRMFTAHVQEEGYGGESYFGYGCNVTKSRRGTKVIDNGGSNGIYHARMLRYADEGLVFYLVTNENKVNANKVMPNVTQLYFMGKIVEDGLTALPPFESPEAEQIFGWMSKDPNLDLAKELKASGLDIKDDMILLDAGRHLIQSEQPAAAKTLFMHYTKAFPKIIIA
ncbi:MAG: serine hydrolase domain-containing protein [Bacteroidia bacterium]